MDMIRPAYDPRFVEFLMAEGIREHLRMETVGHTGPYGEAEIRREMGEVSTDRRNWQSETALTTAALARVNDELTELGAEA